MLQRRTTYIQYQSSFLCENGSVLLRSVDIGLSVGRKERSFLSSYTEVSYTFSMLSAYLLNNL
jgi:hypothetical protein